MELRRLLAGTPIPASSAARLTVPTVPGDGVAIDVFNQRGGNVAPTPGDVRNVTPTGSTLSPFIDFPRPGSTINVGNSFDTFFASTTVPPEQLSNVSAANFMLRSQFYLAVSPELDINPSTPAIDLSIGVGSDDGYHLTVGDQFLGSATDRSFAYSWAPVSFESPGLYPVQLLFSANAVGFSGLELSWATATSGGSQIIPQSALYLRPDAGERLVTFEEVAAGTNLTDQYRGDGILFNRVRGNLGVVEGRPADFVPVSPTRVYGDPAPPPNVSGVVEWSFVQPGTTRPASTDFVSLFVIDAETAPAVVNAYDAFGREVFSGSYRAGGRTQELVTIRHPQIARVRVQLGSAADPSALDNVRFGTPVALRPDVVVSNVAAPQAAQPGEPLTVTWTLANSGPVPVVGIYEQISLSGDAAVGADSTLAFADFYNGTLAPGQSVTRTATVTPPFNGPNTAGPIYLVVTAGTLGQGNEESDYSNNAAVSAAPTTFERLLRLQLSAQSIAEDAAIPTVVGTVTRSGPLDAALTVQVVSGDTTEMSAPSTVTIPAGQAAANFDLTVRPDGVDDGDQPVTVTVSATGFTAASGQVTVVDADQSALMLSLPSPDLTEGQSATATVTRTTDPGSPLTVDLAAASPAGAAVASQLVVPANVTIPAGQTSASFVVTAPADTLVEKDEGFTLTASSAGHVAGTAALRVLDDDVPTLTLTISPATFSEGSGAVAAVGTITRSIVSDRAFTVKLASGDTSAVTVPITRVIPAGQASATFAISAVDDALFDGTQSVIVTAQGAYDTCGCTITAGAGTATVRVTDDETPSLAVTLSAGVVVEGATVTGTVTRRSDASATLSVALASSDPGQAGVPAGVVIPAGQSSVNFTVTAVDDGIGDGRKSITITAAADGLADGTAVLSGTE